MSNCKSCNSQFSPNRPEQLFCCRSCSNTSRRKLRWCGTCGTELTKKSQNKFCSNTCQKNVDWSSDSKAFETGELELSSRRAKRYLIERDGHRCQMCNNTEWLGKPIYLEMDHIDGNPDNNSIQNLRVICLNCHSTTPTYRAKNKGNGRGTRGLGRRGRDFKSVVPSRGLEPLTS